jgi:hypothetical protein
MPVVASAMALDAFPPEMPDCADFAMMNVFEAVYRPIWNRAAQLAGLDPCSVQLLRRHLARFKRGRRAALKDRHRRLLSSFRSVWETYRPKDVCVVCLFRRPEHFLPCRHGYCEVDVRRYGANAGQYRFAFDSCLLCTSPCKSDFELTPPTRAPRILSLDGGGIRGIAILEDLLILQEALDAYLPGMPIQDHFDYCIGSSAGGIIALSAALKGSSIQTCIEVFTSFAAATFKGRFEDSRPPVLSMLLPLVAYAFRSSLEAIKSPYLRTLATVTTDVIKGRFQNWDAFASAIATAYAFFADSLYPSRNIEHALQMEFGLDAQLDDYSAASRRGAKVAVTATKTFSRHPEFLLTNYNGVGPNACRQGYRHALAKASSGGAKVWEA